MKLYGRSNSDRRYIYIKKAKPHVQFFRSKFNPQSPKDIASIVVILCNMLYIKKKIITTITIYIYIHLTYKIHALQTLHLNEIIHILYTKSYQHLSLIKFIFSLFISDNP